MADGSPATQGSAGLSSTQTFKYGGSNSNFLFVYPPPQRPRAPYLALPPSPLVHCVHAIPSPLPYFVSPPNNTACPLSVRACSRSPRAPPTHSLWLPATALLITALCFLSLHATSISPHQPPLQPTLVLQRSNLIFLPMCAASREGYPRDG